MAPQGKDTVSFLSQPDLTLAPNSRMSLSFESPIAPWQCLACVQATAPHAQVQWMRLGSPCLYAYVLVCRGVSGIFPASQPKLFAICLLPWQIMADMSILT